MLTDNFWLKLLPLYLGGFLMVANLLAAWFHSNLAQHVWNLLHGDTDMVFTKDDLAVAAGNRYGAMGDLWICPLCLGTWCSALGAIGLASLYVQHDWLVALQFVIFCALSWPLGYYVLHNRFSR